MVELIMLLFSFGYQASKSPVMRHFQQLGIQYLDHEDQSIIQMVWFFRPFLLSGQTSPVFSHDLITNIKCPVQFGEIWLSGVRYSDPLNFSQVTITKNLTVQVGSILRRPSKLFNISNNFWTRGWINLRLESSHHIENR